MGACNLNSVHPCPFGILVGVSAYPNLKARIVVGTGRQCYIPVSPAAIANQLVGYMPVAAVIPLGNDVLAGVKFVGQTGILEVDIGITGGAHRCLC